MSMATSAEQDSDFIDELIPGDLLEQAIDWIAANMNPDDVFSESDLNQWADDAGRPEAE